ncbi:MAG: TonB-dependent receptor [Bacteroidales bacterium]
MRISVFLLIAGLAHAIANNSITYAQSAKISLSLKNVTIEEVLNEIEAQTEFYFLFNQKLIDVNRRVNVEVKNEPIKNVLSQLFEGQPINYFVYDRQIILAQKDDKSDGGIPASAISIIKVTGKVSDATSGEALVGVSVVVEGTLRGVITDAEGQFTIDVPQQSRLTFSYVGYEPQTVKIGEQTVLDIRLNPEIKKLEEVVVIGYGVQKKSDLTGAVGVVDVKEMKKLRATGVGEALQGQVSGIMVNSSGEPGSMADVKIRGISSLNGTQPLYVIDGLILENANHLNPNDIESIQVLKDASSAAIYGSRGMNGVIIITTKKGQEGPLKIDFTANYGIDQMPKKIKLMNTLDYLYYNELSYINAGIEWPGRPQMGQYIANTDWQRALFRDGKTQDYNISFSGGNKYGNYLLGLGYFDQDGVIEGPWYKRYSLRINTNGKKGIFSVGENFSVIRIDQRMTQGGSFANALAMPPVIPVYDPNESSHRGGFGYGSVKYPTYASNPIAIQQSIKDIRRNYRMIGNVFAELEIFKGLTFKSNFSMDFRDQTIKSMDYGYTQRYLTVETRWNDRLFTAYDQWLTLIQEQTINFQHAIGKHNIELLGGWSAQMNKVYNAGNEGYNQQVKGLEQTDLISVMNKMWGSEQEGVMESWFTRLNYNFDEKYFFQANVRRDRSSKFYFYDKSRQIGIFPSFSLGYRISKEDFFEPLRYLVNDLKLRGGYGIIGDQSGIGYYDTQATIERSGTYEGFYAVFNGKVFSGAIQTKPVNANLSWEEKATLNMGVDFALLGNRLSGSVEWYKSNTNGILIDLPVAMVTGIGLSPSDAKIWTNYGKIENRGWEFNVTWKDKKGNLDYLVSANVGTFKNKVIALGDNYREGQYNQVNRTEEGRSVADFYLIHTDGIFKSWDEIYSYTTTTSSGEVKLIQPNAKPGDIKYIDYNKDGKIDLNDRQWSGSPIPKFSYGFNLSAGYKGLDFSAFFTGVYGNKIFNGLRRGLESMNSPDNISADNRLWTWDNPDALFPRPVFGTSDNAKIQSNRWLEDGSYLRLKNIQIGYTLPYFKHVVERFRIYVSGQNILTLTGYKGYDPELSGNGIFELGCDWGQYPPVKSFIAGIQFSF